LWAFEWAWHLAKINMRCQRTSWICITNPNTLIFEISAYIRTDELMEYMNLIGSETLFSKCYPLCPQRSIHHLPSVERMVWRCSSFFLSLSSWQWKLKTGNVCKWKVPTGLFWLATAIQINCYRMVNGGCALWE